MYYFTKPTKTQVYATDDGWAIVCKGDCKAVVVPDWRTAMLLAGQHLLCVPHYCNQWYPQPCYPDTFPPYAPPTYPYYDTWSTPLPPGGLQVS